MGKIQKKTSVTTVTLASGIKPQINYSKTSIRLR